MKAAGTPLAHQLPPYARALKLPADGLLWIFTGPLAWDWGRNDSRPKLLLPPGQDATSYIWPVSNLDVVILDTGSTDNYLLKLAHLLLTCGARYVGCVPMKGPYASFNRLPADQTPARYRAEVRHAA